MAAVPSGIQCCAQREFRRLFPAGFSKPEIVGDMEIPKGLSVTAPIIVNHPGGSTRLKVTLGDSSTSEVYIVRPSKDSDSQTISNNTISIVAGEGSHCQISVVPTNPFAGPKKINWERIIKYLSPFKNNQIKSAQQTYIHIDAKKGSQIGLHTLEMSSHTASRDYIKSEIGSEASVTTNSLSILGGSECSYSLSSRSTHVDSSSNGITRVLNMSKGGKSVYESSAKNIVSTLGTESSIDQSLRSIVLPCKDGSWPSVTHRPQLSLCPASLQASHGSAISTLDNSLMQYLYSRGIPEKVARRLLLSASVSQHLPGLPSSLRPIIEQRIHLFSNQ